MILYSKRRPLRLQGYDYCQAGYYFVTICVRNRECLLGSIIDGEMRLNRVGRIVAECWEWLAVKYSFVTLDEWIIMPNHMHGTIFIDENCRGGSRTAPTVPLKSKPLGRLIGAFKTISTKHINIIQQRTGTLFWQRNFYEHVIRNEASLNRIREYIATNPQRWELDRENPLALGKDNFDTWMSSFGQPCRGGSRTAPINKGPCIPQ